MTAPTRSAAIAPAVPAVRGILAVAAVLVFLAGVQLLVFPLDTDERFAWTIASSMTASFLGASYWSAVGLELTGARAATWATARTAVPAVLVFTTLTLVVTLVHLDRFHLDPALPLVTRAVTWAWVAVYASVPVLLAAAWWLQGRSGTGVPPPGGLAPWLRAALAVLAVGLTAFGVMLLVAPAWAGAAWPWELTPLTGRAVGAWCVGLGVAAGHAYLVDDAPSLRPVGVTGVSFGVLQAVALARFGEELDGGPRTVGYVAVVALVGVVGAGLLVSGRRGRASSG